MSAARRPRFALIALVILAAAGCLALGWWQWNRFESNSGTFQNLGYALQWPMFAAFCVYAYRKFVRLEQAPPEPIATPGVVTEIPAGLLPERSRPAEQPDDDPVMREYNAYLAELARADQAQLARADQAQLARADQAQLAPADRAAAGRPDTDRQNRTTA